jgi:hypothetical protein
MVAAEGQHVAVLERVRVFVEPGRADEGAVGAAQVLDPGQAPFRKMCAWRRDR